MSEITKRTRNYKEYEIIKEMKAYSITMPCSKCDGEMKFTGMSFITCPPYNVHKCDKCGYEEEFLDVIYPRVEYR
jgi:hypothetical protein